MSTEPQPIADTNDSFTEKPAELPPAPPPGETASAPASTEPAPAVSPPAPAPQRSGAGDGLLLGLLLVLSFFLGSFVATNADLWLQLAIGRHISAGEHQFGVDPFSWATEPTETHPATYWVHQGWVSSWIFYQLFALDGGRALVVIKALLFTLTIVVLSRIGWKESANRWFLLICLTMAALAISTRLLLNPMVISFLFLAITLLVLDRAGWFALPTVEAKSVSVGCLWILPPLFAVWANLDSWFILGPLVVGLCLAVTILSRWFFRPSPVPVTTLSLVFAASLAACLVNPHHVRVFQLPPELAYIVLTLNAPLPDAIVGGGRTLEVLRQAEPEFTWTISPLSTLYWQRPNIGYNIAGIAFFPLVVLGLLSFTLTAFVKPRPGAPVLHLGRFVLWGVFAIMALVLYRMIPFFAIVAAPLTAMTLGEFLHWQQLQTEASAARHDRSMQLARFVTVPFMLLLLYFAWPGWLHGTTDYNSPRRVAWQVRADPSLEKAAETLQALKEKNACGNVFNISFEQAHYCAWYAPGVKCFMDHRFALFPDKAVTFVRTQRALMDLSRPEGEWQKLFQEHNVNQVLLANFVTNRNLVSWMINADRWRQRGGDNRAMVFSWSGPATTWPVNTAHADWNRRAFGNVPQAQRPPMEGALPPQQLGMWDLYERGTGPQPHGAVEAQLLGGYYEVEHQLQQQFRPYNLVLALGSLASIQTLPGGGMTMAPSLDALWVCQTIVRPRDYGPPGVPIIMVRSARKAVAENPQDYASHVALMQANETVRRNQEDYWQDGPQPSPLRDRLRTLQQIGALYNLTQLQPERYEHHLALAQQYRQSLFLDLALDHMHMAEAALESRKKNQQSLPRDFEEFAGKVAEEIRQFERKVLLRQAKFKEKSLGKNALQLAEFTVASQYQEEVGDRTVATPLGLGKKAIEILGSNPPKGLAQEEQARYLQLYFELLVNMGRSAEVAGILQQPGMQKALPPFVVAQYQVLAGGTMGNYALMDFGLQELEKMFQAQTRVAGGVWFTAMRLVPSINSANVLSMAMLQSLPGLQPFHESYKEFFNTRTLRGIVHLEAGDTPGARELFASSLRDSHPAFSFSDRPIARYYLELLNEQRR